MYSYELAGWLDNGQGLDVHSSSGRLDMVGGACDGWKLSSSPSQDGETGCVSGWTGCRPLVLFRSESFCLSSPEPYSMRMLSVKRSGP